MTAKTSLMKQTWATPGSGGNVGQVRDPQAVGRTGGEVAAKQIRVVWRLRGAHNVARPQARRLECGARAGSAARAHSGYPWCSPRPGPIITWRRKDKDGRPDHFKRTFTADAPSLAGRRHSPRAGGPPRACELRSDSSAPRSSPMPFPQDRGLIDALVREDQKLCRWKHKTKRLRSPKGTSTV